MSALDFKRPDEIRASILGAVVVAISSGAGVEFMRGFLALAQSQVVGLRLSWAEFVRDAKLELGVDSMALLDSALVPIEEK